MLQTPLEVLKQVLEGGLSLAAEGMHGHFQRDTRLCTGHSWTDTMVGSTLLRRLELSEQEEENLLSLITKALTTTQFNRDKFSFRSIFLTCFILRFCHKVLLELTESQAFVG